MHPLTTRPEALNYVRQDDDGNLDALMLAAALTALGVPFGERPAVAVSGDCPACVNWLFAEKSLDGKYTASEIIAKWGDTAYMTGEGREDVVSYIFAAMLNLKTLVNYHLGQAPRVELVKKGRKTLIIPEGTPEAQLGLLINRFTRS